MHVDEIAKWLEDRDSQMAVFLSDLGRGWACRITGPGGDHTAFGPSLNEAVVSCMSLYDGEPGR